MRASTLLLAVAAAAALVVGAAGDAATSTSGSGFAAAFDPSTGRWIGGSSGDFAPAPKSGSGRRLADAATSTSGPNARSAAYDPKTGKWIYSGSRKSLMDAAVATSGPNARAWSADASGKQIYAGGRGSGCIDAATLGASDAFVAIPWTTQVPHPPLTLCRGAGVRFVFAGGEDSGVTQVPGDVCPGAGSLEIAPVAKDGNVPVSFDQAGTYWFACPKHCPGLTQRVDVVG